MNTKHRAGFYERRVKRLLDAVGAALALILLAPVLAVLALLVRVCLGSPVLFCQQRPGRDGKLFTLYKFRSMTQKRDEAGRLLPDELRLTAFGRALRATSLDELPELWNILRGEMSFVGPRPLLAEYLPRYNARQARRHEVLPGLTGAAQIGGRNSLSWEQRFALDVDYVDHVSLWRDLHILLCTGLVVLSRRGIHGEDTATMEDFYPCEEEASL